MSSAEYVEFDAGKVEGRGWTEKENAAWTELVRSLSSFSRAVVKHLPSGKPLLQYSEEVFEDAKTTADAELYFDAVCQESQSTSMAAETESKQEQFAQKVTRIILAKSKRVKQHSRRAQARANRNAQRDASAVQNKAEWPTLIAETAENFKEWKGDLFMHIAMLTLSEHFEKQGLLVNRRDDSRTKQQRKQIKKLIHFHAEQIGVDKFELKGFAFISQATGLLVKPGEAHQSCYLDGNRLLQTSW